ncbi:MAG: DUF4349 domain-containing protein [Oscillospiraceae bacterium]|jgi:hypothetical protein
MKKAKRFLALLCAALLLLSFAACGSKTASDAAVPAAGAENMKAESTSDTGGAEKSTDLALTGGQTVLPSADKIIFSGRVLIETRRFDDALAELTKLVADSGGFVENSSVYGASYDETGAQRGYRSADYTIRIPAEKFFSVSDRLKALGNVTSTQTQADNITMQYTDAQAHLDALKVQEARLLDLLAKAQSMEDILKIEEQLTRVRYEIENLTSQLKNWDAAVSYSTLSVTLQEVAYYSKDGSNGTSYGKQLSEAFVNSLYGVARFFKDFLKLLVAAVPILVVAAGIAALVIWVGRRVKRKKAAKASENEDKHESD